MADVKLIEAEALRVGPGDVLVIRLPEELAGQADDIFEALVQVGLAGRSLVVLGDGIEMAVVEAPS